MRRAATLSVCGLMAGMALIACGGGSSSTRGSTPAASADAPCTNGATATAAAAPQRYHEGTAVPFVALDDEAHCRLRRALLTQADLPDGWSERQFEVRPAVAAAGGQVDCDARAPASGIVVTDLLIEPNGQYGGGQWVFAFKPGGASELIRAVKQKCAEFAAAGGDSSTDYHAIDLPPFGDESFGVRGQPSTAAVYIRRGDLVTLLVVGSEGDPVAELSQLAAKADAKLANVGPLPLPTSSP